MIKLVVFDLDFTLWDAGGTWCDHTNPPYRKVNGHIEDSYGSRIVLYPDVRVILDNLVQSGVTMALASRTGAPNWAKELLCLFEIEHYFDYQEIYPGSKTEHFTRLQTATGIPFDQMIFFDDEMRNVSEVGNLGVNAIFVDNGMTHNMLEEALFSNQ